MPPGALRRLLWRWAPVLPLAGGALASRAMGRPGLAAVLGLVALALAIGRRMGPAARVALALVVLALAAACWSFPVPAAGLGRALPVLGDLLMAAHFGATLRRGQEPLITRYDRYDPASDPAESAGYTRGLTLLWTLLFLVLAPLHAALLLGLPPLAAPAAPLPVLAGTLAAMLLLFVGEHWVRNRRFPRQGLATPLRTLRAVVAAHAGGPAQVSRHA